MGKSPEAVRSELHLRASSVPSHPSKYPLVGGSSEVGWYLIVARGREHRLIAEPVIQRLSADCEMLTCTDRADIIAEGELPPEFPTQFGVRRPVRDSRSDQPLPVAAALWHVNGPAHHFSSWRGKGQWAQSETSRRQKSS